MAKTKKYEYDYEQYEAGKGPDSMIGDILANPEFDQVTDLVVGSWGSVWEDDCQKILDGIVENKERFVHVERLFVGDMVAAKAGKANGVEQICAWLGISPKEAAAAGDSPEDEAMMLKCL